MMKDAGFNAFRDAHQPHNLYYKVTVGQRREIHVLASGFSAHIWYDTPCFSGEFQNMLRQWIKERRQRSFGNHVGVAKRGVLPKEFAEECARK